MRERERESEREAWNRDRESFRCSSEAREYARIGWTLASPLPPQTYARVTHALTSSLLEMELLQSIHAAY